MSIHPHQTSSTSTHLPTKGIKKSFSKHPKKSVREAGGYRRSQPKSIHQEIKPQGHKWNSASLLCPLWKVLEQFPCWTLSWQGTLEEPGQAAASVDMVMEQILECSYTCKYSIHLVMKKDNHRAPAIFIRRLLRWNSSAVMGSLLSKPLSAAGEQKAANRMGFLEGFKGDPGNFRTLNLTITQSLL